MTDKKKNPRMLKILFGTLALFLIFGLGIRRIFDSAMNATDYVYLAAGALSVWIFFVNLRGEPISYGAKHERETSGGSKDLIFSIISFMIMMGLVFGGMILLLIPLGIDGLTPEEYASVSEGMFYIFIANIFSLAGALLVMNAESKYIVKDGNIVLVDGKVLYPGEKYRIWQWEYKKAQVVPEEFTLKIESLEIRSKNDEKVDIRVATSVRFDIKEAKKMGVTDIDLPVVFRDLETRLSQEIKKQASSNTLGSLFTGKLDPEKFIIAGVPITWEGRVQISIG